MGSDSIATAPIASCRDELGRIVVEMEAERGPRPSDVELVGDVELEVDAASVRPPRPRTDWTIAELGTRQHGVVSRTQLLAAGIGPGAIETRLRGHRLHRLHRGVYAVGHTALDSLAWEMAAVLACGPGAAISHRTAGVRLQLLERRGPLIDVTVGRSNRRRPGLDIHRSRTLRRGDVYMHEGIPTTTPTRTLLDLAEVVQLRDLERAFDEAITRRLTTYSTLAAAVERSKGRRGSPKLQDMLARSGEPTLTRSEAEERCLALVRQAGLPPPAVNAVVAGHRVDFLWGADRLVVEVDGFRFHSSRAAFERDRRRDAELQAAGFRVVRVTWRQLAEEPVAVVARLARALAGWEV